MKGYERADASVVDRCQRAGEPRNVTESVQSLLVSIGISVVVSLVTFWGIGGLIHWWFYVRRRAEAEQWKLQPKRFMKPELVRHAFWLGSVNIVMGGIVGGVFSWNVVRGGWSSLYFDPLEHGVPWLIASALVGFFTIDAGLYYSHRLQHHKKWFRYVHRWHHRYTAPVMFTTTAVHPLEFLLFQFFVLLPAILVPMHWAVYIVVVLYTYLIGMIDHCGIKVSWPLPLHSGNRFHDDHHVYFHCNYGHHTQVFDQLHGTMHRQDRRYGEDVFGEAIEAPRKAETADDELAA
jgi:lathosterol oxidase